MFEILDFTFRHSIANSKFQIKIVKSKFNFLLDCQVSSAFPTYACNGNDQINFPFRLLDFIPLLPYIEFGIELKLQRFIVNWILHFPFNTFQH